jgi:hypothetical protein
MIKNKIDVSMVVATHKGVDRLPFLVESIKQNTFLPKEIIICGTSYGDIKYLKKKDIKQLNIRFYKSKIKNQIVQRKLAISKISQNYILQIDDDNYLNNDFFKNLDIHVKDKDLKKVTMTLVLIPNKKEQSFRWSEYYRSNLYFRLFLRFFNYGKKISYMSILPSGRICPLLPKGFSKRKKLLKNIQWTNSTICYHKSALNVPRVNPIIKKNEKSYYEDVIFSHNLYQKGYKLQLDPKLKGVHPFFNSLDFKVHLKTLKTQFYIVNKFNKNYIMFLFDMILATIFLIFRK